MALNRTAHAWLHAPRGLFGVLLCLVMLVAGLPVAFSHADEPIDEVLVELTSVSPTILSDRGELVISGRITNESSQPLVELTARLWRDATPIRTLGQLDAAQNNLEPSGEAMFSAAAVATIGAAGTLEVGASADFTVRADLSANAVEQSWLSQPDAAYQVGVEVFSDQLKVGGAYTLLAYPGETQADVGTIVLMNARPSLLPLDSGPDQVPVFANDSLARELETRLAQLLALGMKEDVLVVIDPMLYDEISQLAQPHVLRQADGSNSELTTAGSAAARSWLDAIDTLLPSGRVTRSLYGSLDVTQAAASGQEELIGEAATLPSGHRLEGLPLIAVPYSAEIDQQTVPLLEAVSPRYVLVSNLGDQLSYEASGLQLVSVLACSAAQPPLNPVEANGAVLARQLIAGNQQMASIQLVTTTSQADLAQANYPWRHRRSITELLESVSATGVSSWPDQSPEPDEQLAQATLTTSELLQTWTELVQPAAINTHLTTQLLVQAWSTTFERSPDTQTQWLQLASEPAVATVTSSNAIQLRITDWVTTSEDNLLPVTVINNTPFKVEVGIRFDSDNPLRISVEESEPIIVQPGESAAIRVRPITEGNGVVAMRAQAVTSNGHPVGAPVSFTVTGTDAGRVAWIIILASGVVLLGATAYRVRSMRRENREE